MTFAQAVSESRAAATQKSVRELAAFFAKNGLRPRNLGELQALRHEWKALNDRQFYAVIEAVEKSRRK